MSMQQVRSLRAVQSLHEYSFRRNGSAAVVTNRRDRNRSYNVTAVSCDCQDFRERCQGKGLRCKHLEMVALTPLMPSPAVPSPVEEAIREEAERMARAYNRDWGLLPEDSDAAKPEQFTEKARRKLTGA